MIDKNNLNLMKKEIKAFDEFRESLIKLSRNILRFSKMSISNTHRGNLKQAESLLKTVDKTISDCNKLIKKDPKLAMTGAYSAALQEYVEAKTYLSFIKIGKIPSSVQLKVPTEDYLLGLCDLTGELARKAVMSAIEENYVLIRRIKIAVDEIYNFFLSLDLRNSELRKKADAVKWNLKKIENILYDIKIRKKK